MGVFDTVLVLTGDRMAEKGKWCFCAAGLLMSISGIAALHEGPDQSKVVLSHRFPFGLGFQGFFVGFPLIK